MPRELIISELLGLLPPDRVVTDPAELFVYESDGFTIAKARPAAVVFPQTTVEVVEIVKILMKHDAQIIPRGSGTGLAGGCVAFEDGVVISTAKMNRIFKIDLDNRVAHVQAGVRNLQLSDAVAMGGLEQGQGTRGKGQEKASLAPRPSPFAPSAYHFAPDPSSQRASSIGGNASTNAGGIHTLKDFVTSNHVLGIEMVLGDGTVLTVGSQNGAYEHGPLDLPGLICGHEGTFGVITSLWVRLVPKQTSFRTMVATFSTSNNACNAVSEIIASGLLPAAIEMMDATMIRIVEDAFHFGFSREAQALLLIEIDGINELLDPQMEQVIEMCKRNSAMNVEFSKDPNRRAALWKARKSAFGAIGRVSQSYCTQDACVPRSRLADVLEKIYEIGRQHNIAITNVFHAGDGNVHPIFLYDERDETAVQNVLVACEKVLKYCIDVGGTLTGEHGIGVEKLHIMSYQFDAPTMAQFQSIKDAFDPEERINAGKLLPSDKVRIELLKPGRQSPQ